MQVDVDGQVHSIRADESEWIEINDATDSVVIKVTGDFLTDEAFEDLDSSTSALKEKLMYKFVKKATTELMDVILQVDCVYKISNISPECLITVEDDSFDLGDKTWMMQDFQIMYPKLICNDDIKVELLHAKGKNSKEVIKKYKKMGLLSDMGLDFITMFLAYPLRGLYFKHLCKPSVLKKNILNVEAHKANTQKRNSGKKIGCIGGCFSLIAVVLLFFILDAFVFSVLFVSSEKPYLVASDYSTVTFGDDVYVRIDELPDYAYPSTFLGATIWQDSRTDGLSKWDQSMQGDKVQLFEDNEGREYLWLVEDYTDTIFNENGDDFEYEDFDEHYVYVFENS